MRWSKSPTLFVTVAAIGVWLLSLWTELRWPWISHEQGGPWPFFPTIFWWKSWIYWVVLWMGLIGYWYIRLFYAHTVRAPIILGSVALFHFFVYFSFKIQSLRIFEEVFHWLAGSQMYGAYRIVVQMKTPSFLLLGISWLFFTEVSKFVFTRHR
ncbi:hypothetical protein [Ardenticatena maritima]|uniref:hypothetical protein n=1 Tax=Ardenticatena maritima TaxID=872965 RepID=UPI00128F84C7|nr:hypothetical protein [Ardenticatena maritima]